MSSTIDTGGPKDYTPMENEYAQHAARAKAEVETLSAEAKKRFLSLEEVGVGGVDKVLPNFEMIRHKTGKFFAPFTKGPGRLIELFKFCAFARCDCFFCSKHFFEVHFFLLMRLGNDQCEF